MDSKKLEQISNDPLEQLHFVLTENQLPTGWTLEWIQTNALISIAASLARIARILEVKP